MKEQEIKRLTTPVKKVKGFLSTDYEDIEGNPVKGNFIEPKPGILSDDEILFYAPKSTAARKIRLSRGIGTYFDKLSDDPLAVILSFSGIMGILIIFSNYMSDNFYRFTEKQIILIRLFLVFCCIVGIYLLYIFYFKDYSNINKLNDMFNKINVKSNETNDVKNDETNVKNDKYLIYEENLDELKRKYESKEKIARILIKEYFPPPQITYDKFISEIDNWCDVFNNQYDLGLNLLNIENTSKISGRYMNILNILNLIIEKTEDLVIELTVQSNKQNNDEKMNEILIKMQDVVNSVKEYKI